MTERRVLFLVSDFAPLTSVGRIRPQKMCKFLPEFGWRANVLTFEPPPGSLIDPATLAEVPSDTPVYRVPCPQPLEAPVRWVSRAVRAMRGGIRRPTEGAKNETMNAAACGAVQSSNPAWLERCSRQIDRIKQGLTRRLMVPDEGVTGVRAMMRVAVDLIRRDRVAALVCSVPGFSPWLAGVAAGRRTGVPVVVDYRDLWHGDVLRTWLGPLRSRLELVLERRALARTAAVVTVSGEKTRFVRGLDPAAEQKPYVTIYNGFDADDAAGITPMRPDRDTGRLVLLYTGRLYRHRRIDPLVESLGRLVSRGDARPDQLRLRLLGLIEPAQRQRIEQIVERYYLGDVVEFGGYVARPDALAQQLGADALVLVVDPGPTSAGVLPGKITEYIGLNRFVLAVAPLGEARDLLEKYGNAASAAGDDPDGLDEAVTGLFRRWRANPNLTGRSAATEVIPTRRDNAARLAELLNEVVDLGAPARPAPSISRAAPEPCGVA
ncbi:MAG: glycosyltransferase family 4 protein [bacterium]|nr:glycosyltransferase family 4 protein [bacterium]